MPEIVNALHGITLDCHKANYVVRHKVGEYEINVMNCHPTKDDPDMLKFPLLFCPRSDDGFNEQLINTGFLPMCNLDCTYTEKCKQDPKYNEWSKFLDTKIAKEYNVE